MKKIISAILLFGCLSGTTTFTSCADKDVRKSRKVQKQRASKRKTNIAKHKNHKKLAH